MLTDGHNEQRAAASCRTDPTSQAAIDIYNENVGTVAEFLGRQIAISGAIDAAGC